jgi:hypothetical protein
LLDARWLVDDIVRQVGDEVSTLFLKDLWLNGVLDVRCSRLFGRAINKLATIVEMFYLGEEVNGEALK